MWMSFLHQKFCRTTSPATISLLLILTPILRKGLLDGKSLDHFARVKDETREQKSLRRGGWRSQSLFSLIETSRGGNTGIFRVFEASIISIRVV